MTLTAGFFVGFGFVLGALACVAALWLLAAVSSWLADAALGWWTGIR